MARERFKRMEPIHTNSSACQILEKRSPMVKGKYRCTQKKTVTVEMAALYSEDLGTQGVKRLRCEDAPSFSTFKLPLTPSEKKRRNDRKARFGATTNGLNKSLAPLYKPLTSGRKAPKEEISGNGPLVGENTNLEKPYLRLTDFPKKEDVRPLEVLVKSLARIKSRYIRYEDFEWANEQLKSVRQDITVQRLRSPFVLEVYETHARILLEHGDLNEFNQCQTVIRSLVEGTLEVDDQSIVDGITSKSAKEECEPLRQTTEIADEFRGYAILYALVRKSWGQLKLELSRVQNFDLEDGEDFESSAIHALQVVKAVEDCEYRTFFRLYDCAPHLSAYLMDYLVKRVRDSAYERIIAAYRPTVSVEHIRDSLHIKDLEETRRFLRQQGAVFVQEKGEPPFWIDCKMSQGGS